MPRVPTAWSKFDADSACNLVNRRHVFTRLCRAARILHLVPFNEGRVQFPHAFDAPDIGKRLGIKANANFYVLLRDVVAVNQHFTDLVSGIGILAFIGIVVLD